MCYNPITIINPSKYISIKHRDRFLLQVPCGHCAECQSKKSMEWNYRTYYEFLNTFEVNNDGFVYFDTLTYDDEHLPYMNELHEDLPHIPCFRSKDLTDFFKDVRITLGRKFGIAEDAFSYFVCSEYGSKFARPHYHLLMFMRCSIDPLKLSLLIARKWKHGRTDGIPYKSAFYVDRHNVLRNKVNGDVLACAKYVTKYVEKDCKLQEIIDKRIKQAEFILGKVKQKGVKWQKLVTKVSSEVNEFHLQSLHYGELSLRDIDLYELIKTGCVKMPSHEVITLLPIPMYCQRKLFYDRVCVNKMYGWQLNETGMRYKELRKPYVLQNMKERFDALCELANVDYDTERLAHYVVDERGRYKDAVLEESLIEHRVKAPTHYLYITQNDKENIGVGISLDFLGNSKLGYAPLAGDNIIKIKDFISKYVYIDDKLEEQLKILYNANFSINLGEQKYYSRLQELKALYKNELSFGM